MYKLVLIAISLGLIACGRVSDTDVPVLSPPPPTDPTFTPEIHYFQTLYNIQVNVSVSFDAALDEGDTLGKCFHYKDQPNGPHNYVVISPKWWNKISKEGRDALILHELGHCVFSLDHNNDRGIVGGILDMPLSIMNKYFIGDTPIYKNNKEWYDTNLR